MAKIVSQPESAVGSPSPAQPSGPVATALDLLRQIVAALGSVLRPKPKNPNRVLKVRAKAAPIVPQLLQLAAEEPRYAPSGSDPAALLAQWTLAVQLSELVTPVNAFRKELDWTVLQLQAEVWQVVLSIYKLVAADSAVGGKVAELSSRMEASLKVGPKVRTKVSTPIKPTPVKGAKAQKALLAGPALEAAKALVGGSEQETAPAAPAAANAPAPQPPSSNGVAGGKPSA